MGCLSAVQGPFSDSRLLLRQEHGLVEGGWDAEMAVGPGALSWGWSWTGLVGPLHPATAPWVGLEGPREAPGTWGAGISGM